jgi:hypothetical protein
MIRAQNKQRTKLKTLLFLTADDADFRRFLGLISIFWICDDAERRHERLRSTVNSPPLEGWQAKPDGVVCLINHNINNTNRKANSVRRERFFESFARARFA